MLERIEPRIKFAKNSAKEILEQLNITQPPIILKLVVDSIRSNYNLQISKWKFGDNVDGIQMNKNGISIIGYNEERHVHRQRFTVAHEIGHLVLGHTTENYLFDLSSKKPEEKEANAFAAELLIPCEMLKSDILSGLDIKKLSARYFVSNECLWWKIEEERLINKIKI